MPNDGARPIWLSIGRFATRKQTPRGGSVEASNLHEATSAGRPSCPSAATLPRGMRKPVYRGTSLGIRRRAWAEYASPPDRSRQDIEGRGVNHDGFPRVDAQAESELATPGARLLLSLA